MILTKQKLQAALDKLTKALQQAHEARALIAEHCIDAYGVDPSDIDNDEFLDRCDGYCGQPDGMTVEDFDMSMREAIDRAGIKRPNARVTGAGNDD